MLVFRVASEFTSGGFENVGGRRVSLRHSPRTVDGVAVKRQLWLGSGEAELAAVPGEPGAAVVFQKQPDATCQILFVDPIHPGLPGIHILRVLNLIMQELDGTRTILTDMTDDAEGVARGNMETPPPFFDNPLVVR